MKWWLAGMLAGALTGGVLFGFVTPSATRSDEAAWQRVEVVTVGRRVPAGATLAADQLVVRSVPSASVHPMDVRGDDLPRLVGAAAPVDLLPGDAVSWWLFAGAERAALSAQCVARIAPVVAAAASAARDEAATQVVRRDDDVPTDEVPAPTSGLSKTIEVLALSREAPAATIVDASQLTIIAMPREFVTRSNVPASDRDAVVGSRVVLDAEPGEPLLWQHLDAPRPQTLAGCESLLSATAHAARVTAARDAAREQPE